MNQTLVPQTASDPARALMPWLATLTWLLATAPALALPTLYPTRANALAGIKNGTTSTVLSDTLSERIAWVLPPSAGTARATGLQFKSANLALCDGVKDTVDGLNDSVKRLALERKRISEIQVELDKRQERYFELNQKAESIFASSSDIQTIESLSERVSSIESRLTALYGLQEACAEQSKCSEIAKEISDLRKEKSKANQELADLRVAAREEYTRYKRARSAANAAREEWDTYDKSYDRIITKLKEIKQDLWSSYAGFAKVEGGMSSIYYNTGWDENIIALNAANPGVTFQKVNTRDAQLAASLVVPADTAEAYYSGLPAIKSYIVNGVPHQPFGSAPPTDMLAAMPTTMSATLNLNLIGACPMARPELFKFGGSASEIPAIGISATYQYASAFHTKVTFTYNLIKFFESMKESGTDGGFFSSESWSRMSQKEESKGTLEFKWELTDPDSKLDQEHRSKIEKEVKEELIARVLKQFATPIGDASITYTGAPGLQPHGAAVLADGLSSTCGYYSFYCVAGSWILRGLDAIFGSSEQRENYVKTVDVTEKEHWDVEEMRWKSEVTVFTDPAAKK